MIKVIPYKFYKQDVSIYTCCVMSRLILQVRAVALAGCEEKRSAGFQPLPGILYTLTTSRVLDVALLQLMLKRTRCSQSVMLAIVCVSVAILLLGIAGVRLGASASGSRVVALLPG